jgi:hypothetical protein
VQEKEKEPYHYDLDETHSPRFLWRPGLSQSATTTLLFRPEAWSLLHQRRVVLKDGESHRGTVRFFIVGLDRL